MRIYSLYLKIRERATDRCGIAKSVWISPILFLTVMTAMFLFSGTILSLAYWLLAGMFQWSPSSISIIEGGFLWIVILAIRDIFGGKHECRKSQID